MFKYLIASCPINGQERTTSDWWLVHSRHVELDSAESELAKIPRKHQTNEVYRIFHLTGYKNGQQFNIRTVREHERARGTK